MSDEHDKHSVDKQLLWLGERLSLKESSPGLDAGTIPIKIWIPKPLKERLDEVGDHLWLSRSGVIRFFIHGFLYGYSYALTGQSTHVKRTTRRRLFPGSALHARTGRATTPELGKNSENIKIWLAEHTCGDLEACAGRWRRPLSQCIREILVQQVFGYVYLQA
ncbi:MAG TPA: hypothetical protein PLU72_03025 [Candidatus Ozemobacteraceae bacterium]|nr:hypothetical protein [Candidatus Ozemobacteraceae bacterium]